jgi:hypothetical protein
MRTFSEYKDRVDRDNRQHLKILKALYNKVGFKVDDHLDDRKDPYIFINKPSDDYPKMDEISFHGVRIYCRGKDVIAYRCQNRETTEPFGEAYILDVKGMYKSLTKEGVDQKKVGKKLAHYLTEEILNFFLESVKAEKDYSPDLDGSGNKFGKATVGSMGTDYGASVQTPGIGSSAGR